MTKKLPPSEPYAAREARAIDEFRFRVISDPTSHPDHAAEAKRRLSAPRTLDGVADILAAMPPGALDYLGQLLRREATLPDPMRDLIQTPTLDVTDDPDDEPPTDAPKVAPPTEAPVAAKQVSEPVKQVEPETREQEYKRLQREQADEEREWHKQQTRRLLSRW
jgi:hypothetical protein